MVNPIAIINGLPDAFTWDEANAVAASMGGRLYRDVRPDVFTNPINLALVAGSADQGYIYWFDAIWSGTAWTWSDGTPVPALHFDGQDPNSDDVIGNEIDSVALSRDGSYWIDGGDTRRALIAEFTSPKSIVGTNSEEIFFGGGGVGEVLKAGGGDDEYYGPGGGKILMGAGNDYVQLGDAYPVTPWTPSGYTAPRTVVYDGAGEDVIVANPAPVGGVVSAAIDGANDIFHRLARVSYADDTAGFTVEAGAENETYVRGAMGDDVLYSIGEIVGGSGDDTITGSARIQGGAGDDVLRPGTLYPYVPTPGAYADGGAGNDTLYTSVAARAELRGGAGDDTLILADAASVSGGSGDDSFIFTAVARVTINDLASGDLIDLSALLPQVEDPFAGGYLKASHSKGYTYVSIDLDGGADGLQPFFTLKGVYGALDDFLA